MTVSHMFYDGRIYDVSTNYEDYIKSGKKIFYDIEDIGF